MTRTIRKGSRGSDVARWQNFLKAQGFDPGPIDEIFGEPTYAASRAFQEKHGLAVDGIVGRITLSKAAALGMRELRRLRNAEVTPALTARAKETLALHRTKPYGSEFPFEIAGVRYVARIEEHFHAVGGPTKPWGPHPGVSLFLDAPLDRTVETADDLTGDALPVPADVAAPVAFTGVVVIDPGHGGSATVGSSSANNAKTPTGVLEKDMALTLATLVREALAELAVDVRVEMTRTDDRNLSLQDRARFAAREKADAFLSIHFNAHEGDARGVETWVRPRNAGNVNFDADRRFADRVAKAVHSALREFDPEAKNRGVKEGALGVLRDDYLGNTGFADPCRACLLEVEFIDTQAVDELFNTGPRAAEVRRAVAVAIAKALFAEVQQA